LAWSEVSGSADVRRLTSRWASKQSRNEGVTRKLTLVSAPAGFGETTLPAVCICAKAAVGV
jgi:ATP/maltotriose-dependent transcriptional regulator MalT